jgi:hypothetical protein
MHPSSSNHGKTLKRHAPPLPPPPPAKRIAISDLLNPAPPREARASSSSTPRDGSSLSRQNTNTHHTHFSSGGSDSQPPVPSPTSPTDARRVPPKLKYVYPKNKQCSYLGCYFMYKFDSNRRSHVEAAHEKIKHKCETCGFEFTRAHNLTAHKKIHLENQPKYVCNLDDCINIEFREKKGYDRHVKAVHNKERPYLCNLCGATFAQKSNGKVHKLKCKGPRS